MSVKTNIAMFSAVAFILLAVLFGMNIMTFIFGSLSSGTDLPPLAATVINETGGFLNFSGYVVTGASSADFSNFAVTQIKNSTNGNAIATNLYTSNATTGRVTNATTVTFTAVTIDYTYLYSGAIEVQGRNVQANSLTSINTYATGSQSQFSILSISIVLVLLLGVFALFYKNVVGGSIAGNREKEGNFG